MQHIVILAGGSGTRLWPASQAGTPKHLLVFEGQQTLLRATLERVACLAMPSQTWILTSRAQADLVAEALPMFNANQILVEPVQRNTAASIGYAALKLRHIEPDATMVVLPADHIIKPASAFCEIIRRSIELVEQSPQLFVTLGVKPTFPATSYGYIQRKTAYAANSEHSSPAYSVLRFCEKPNRETAEAFCQSGHFYWNAGVFVWKAQTILELLHQHEPELRACLQQIEQALGTPEESMVTEEAFQSMKSISIDYAVMERSAERTIVLESTFDWNDVGTWTALDRLYADRKDESNNLAIDSQLLSIDSSGCTVRCDDPKHLVALVGVHNLVVIQTATATLIAQKEQEESVRQIAELVR